MPNPRWRSLMAGHSTALVSRGDDETSWKLHDRGLPPAVIHFSVCDCYASPYRPCKLKAPGIVTTL